MARPASRQQPKTCLRPLVLALTLIPSLVLDTPVRAQEGACEGLLERGAGELARVLQAVPKYGGTYALVYREADATALEDLHQADDIASAGHAGSPALAIGEQAFGRPLVARPFAAGDAGRLVREVLEGTLDGAVIWAPLAGLAVGQLDFNYALSIKTLGLPSPPPPFFAAVGPAAADDPCADEIRGLLEGYGVIAAEQLVPLDIKTLLALAPRARNIEAAKAGANGYAQHCARCHGPEALAATGALAPVDLLRSVQRFSWPGFLYIVLNGRQQNGMPGFRGSLERAQIESIYQYVRERAHGTIAPSKAALEQAAATPRTGSAEPGANQGSGV